MQTYATSCSFLLSLMDTENQMVPNFRCLVLSSFNLQALCFTRRCGEGGGIICLSIMLLSANLTEASAYPSTQTLSKLLIRLVSIAIVQWFIQGVSRYNSLLVNSQITLIYFIYVLFQIVFITIFNSSCYLSDTYYVINQIKSEFRYLICTKMHKTICVFKIELIKNKKNYWSNK